MPLNYWRTFEVSLQRPTGSLVTTFFRLRRRLRLTSLFENLSASKSAKSTFFDPKESSIGLVYEGHQSKMALSISFPSNAQLMVDGQALHNPTPRESDALHRMAVTLPTADSTLEFKFPNDSLVQIKSRPANRHDLWNELQRLRPITWVVLAHLAVLTTMFLNFAIPEFKKLKPKDLQIENMQTNVVTPQGSVIRSSSPSVPNTRSLMRTLDQLLKKSPKAAGTQYSGFSKELKTGPIFQGGDPKISFAAPQTVDNEEFTIDEEAVRRALLSKESQLQDCYNDVLIRDSSLQGRPQIVLDVSKTGMIDEVSINYLTARPQSLTELRQCFRKVLRSLRLPEASQSFAVTQTLILAH